MLSYVKYNSSTNISNMYCGGHFIGGHVPSHIATMSDLFTRKSQLAAFVAGRGPDVAVWENLASSRAEPIEVGFAEGPSVWHFVANAQVHKHPVHHKQTSVEKPMARPCCDCQWRSIWKLTPIRNSNKTLIMKLPETEHVQTCTKKT